MKKLATRHSTQSGVRSARCTRSRVGWPVRPLVPRPPAHIRHSAYISYYSIPRAKPTYTRERFVAYSPVGVMSHSRISCMRAVIHGRQRHAMDQTTLRDPWQDAPTIMCCQPPRNRHSRALSSQHSSGWRTSRGKLCCSSPPIPFVPLADVHRSRRDP